MWHHFPIGILGQVWCLIAFLIFALFLTWQTVQTQIRQISFKGCEFDPGRVPYFPGDWSWNNFHGHSPPFRWFIQEGFLSVTSESLCKIYWLIAWPSLPRKNCVVRWTDRPAMTIAVDLGRKARKQTKKRQISSVSSLFAILTKHSMNSSPDNQHFICEKKVKMFEI